MYRNRPQHFGALVSTLAIGLVMHSAGAGNPVQAEPAAPLASSFPGPLWEVVAPKGGTASVANAHLFLNVPGGSNHDPLRPSNESVQVVQPIGNQDFDISIKIDSEVVAADAGTSRGPHRARQRQGLHHFRPGHRRHQYQPHRAHRHRWCRGYLVQ